MSGPLTLLLMSSLRPNFFSRLLVAEVRLQCRWTNEAHNWPPTRHGMQPAVYRR
ncbi:hypothetical protein BKA56DRAFT_570608 [Ilyonectria sp. MPI-CAGE-AT-0026]|nr:hypothetical protein BKA56DRAFT_570608 [Ilyonectria sp. MPI-CAGE-AT-0026]